LSTSSRKDSRLVASSRSEARSALAALTTAANSSIVEEGGENCLSLCFVSLLLLCAGWMLTEIFVPLDSVLRRSATSVANVVHKFSPLGKDSLEIASSTELFPDAMTSQIERHH
jgi:hypothetical protein